MVYLSFDYAGVFSGVVTEIRGAMGAIVPGVVTVFAIIAAIKMGFGMFRRVTSEGGGGGGEAGGGYDYHYDSDGFMDGYQEGRD